MTWYVTNSDMDENGKTAYSNVSASSLKKTVRSNPKDWPILIDAERIFVWTEDYGMRVCFLVREDLLE